MKAISTTVLFWILAFSLHASLPVPVPQPLPSGPLLNRAPDFARWIIVYGPALSTADSSASGSPPFPSNLDPGSAPAGNYLIVTKTKNIYHEEAVAANGTTEEKWRIGHLQVMHLPNVKGLVVVEPSSFRGESINRAFYADYSKSDFTDFEWISSKNYSGVANFLGRKCLVFLIMASPLQSLDSRSTSAPAIKPSVISAAFIDVDTHLPVYLETDGQGQTYQLEKASQNMLTLPAEVQEALALRSARLKTLSSRSSAL